MGEMTDRFFLRPRQLLAASEVNVYDAINCVVYAKLPLKNVLRGKSLVAGFIRHDEKNVVKAFMSQKQIGQLIDKWEEQIAPLRYPVGPSQYELLLERMVEAGETDLPFFFHEHHQLVDRRRREAMFYQAYSDLAEDVKKTKVALQLTDSRRTYSVLSDAWMTGATFNAYLDNQGVAPWWDKNSNVESHARLERILFSDAWKSPSNDTPDVYDDQQIPSLLFAGMLLRRSRPPRGFVRPAEVASNSYNGGSSAPGPELTRSYAPKRAPPERRAPQSVDSASAAPPVDGEERPLPTGDVKVQLPEAASFLEEGDARTEVNRLNQKRNPVPRQPPQPAVAGDDETLLTKQEVADLLSVSRNTIDNYRKLRQDFPKEISYGRNSIRWKLGEIRRWRDQQKSQ